VAPQALPDVENGRQFRVITEAARCIAAGDVVLIHSGIYREAVVIERNGTSEQPIRFEAAPGANVIITGMDRIPDWRADGEGIYSAEWLHDFVPWAPGGAYPADEYHRLIGRCEQVAINDVPLRQTLSLAEVGRGMFFVDMTAKRLYISPPAGVEIAQEAKEGVSVEAATRPLLWDCKGEFVTTRGLRFRYASNHAQEGAATFSGHGDVVEDCIFERTNATGASFCGPEQIVRRCTFQENGQQGFLAYRAHKLLLTDCLVLKNNTKGFNRNWEAGGDKLVLSRDVVIEKSRFLQNKGIGLWFDIGNENCTVRNCFIADNEAAGLFYEISYGLQAHDNVIVANGLAPDPSLWGAQAGISISSSPDCLITRNLLIANKEGLSFREQGRTTPRIDNPAEAWVWNHHEVVSNNVIAYNRDAQTWGWFAVSDERHWPRALQQNYQQNPSTPEPGVDQALPNNVSLADLHLELINNLYAIRERQPLFIWGPSWMRHISYRTLADLRRALRLERGSRKGTVDFRDYAARDFSVSPMSDAVRMNCYPRGEVPGVRLELIHNPKGDPAN